MHSQEKKIIISTPDAEEQLNILYLEESTRLQVQFTEADGMKTNVRDGRITYAKMYIGMIFTLKATNKNNTVKNLDFVMTTQII